MQVDPRFDSGLTTLGFSALKLKYDEPLSNFTFNFNLRHYTKEASFTIDTKFSKKRQGLTRVSTFSQAISFFKSLFCSLGGLADQPGLLLNTHALSHTFRLEGQGGSLVPPHTR